MGEVLNIFLSYLSKHFDYCLPPARKYCCTLKCSCSIQLLVGVPAFLAVTVSTITMLHTCHTLHTWYCNLTPMHCMNIIFKQYLHVTRVLRSKNSQASNCCSEHTHHTVEDNNSSETKNTKIIIPSGIFKNIHI